MAYATVRLIDLPVPLFSNNMLPQVRWGTVLDLCLSTISFTHANLANSCARQTGLRAHEQLSLPGGHGSKGDADLLSQHTWHDLLFFSIAVDYIVPTTPSSALSPPPPYAHGLPGT